ncbi:hypothetical protein ACFL5Q_05540, partial [Planctomycetota bacterium]
MVVGLVGCAEKPKPNVDQPTAEATVSETAQGGQQPQVDEPRAATKETAIEAFRRGEVYGERGEFDNAIADDDEATRKTPKPTTTGASPTVVTRAS